MKLPAFLLLAAASVSYAAEPALTIYNGGYAVVRETLPIDLNAGVNQVSFAGATAQVEADSVILRDIAGKAEFQILEQSYRNTSNPSSKWTVSCSSVCPANPSSPRSAPITSSSPR